MPWFWHETVNCNCDCKCPVISCHTSLLHDLLYNSESWVFNLFKWSSQVSQALIPALTSASEKLSTSSSLSQFLLRILSCGVKRSSSKSKWEIGEQSWHVCLRWTDFGLRTWLWQLIATNHPGGPGPHWKSFVASPSQVDWNGTWNWLTKTYQTNTWNLAVSWTIE